MWFKWGNVCFLYMVNICISLIDIQPFIVNKYQRTFFLLSYLEIEKHWQRLWYLFDPELINGLQWPHSCMEQRHMWPPGATPCQSRNKILYCNYICPWPLQDVPFCKSTNWMTYDFCKTFQTRRKLVKGDGAMLHSSSDLATSLHMAVLAFVHLKYTNTLCPVLVY